MTRADPAGEPVMLGGSWVVAAAPAKASRMVRAAAAPAKASRTARAAANRRPRRCSAVAVATLTLAALSACSGAPESCPNDLPARCTSAPSYRTEVAPIVAARCQSCHAPEGTSAERPLDSYAATYRLRTTVLTQVYGCQMPPRGSPALLPAERAALLEWLVCGAPDN